MHRYSNRLSWSAPTNAFSLLLEGRRGAGYALLDLTVSNPTVTLANYPHADIAGAYGALTDFTYQPDPLGAMDARHEIVSWYAARGIKLDSNQLALTASTSEAYSLLFKLLCNQGDEVLIPSPSYPLFEYLAKLDGVTLRPYRLHYDGIWHIDFESIKAAISTNTRALIIVNPNNPTGSFLKTSEWKRLEQLALETGLPLIADEVFMDYPLSESADRIATLVGHDNVLSFSLNGLSKSAGMPQMKLGWIAVNGPPPQRQLALERLELLLDTYLSVATPVQRCLPALFEIGAAVYRDIAKNLQVNRNALEKMLPGTCVHSLHCEAGWSAVLRVPAVWPEETWITRLLEHQSVIVQPGYFFDLPMEACLVVSLLTDPAIFAQGMERLLTLASTL